MYKEKLNIEKMMRQTHVMYEGGIYGAPTEDEAVAVGLYYHQDYDTVFVYGPAYKVAWFASNYPRWYVRVWVE